MTTKNASSVSTPSNAMNSILVHNFITNFDDLENAITFSKETAIPSLKKNEILVRVLACSLHPGDTIMAQGNIVFMHPEKFPYVPGMDICGIVQDPNGSDFKEGDIVVASNGFSPIGGMADFMAVPKGEAVLKPPHVNIIHAAACSSAITARNAVMDYVQEGDRVLILGGSGGVGSAAISLAKRHAKASFVATTSTQVEMCEKLGADVVIDYRKENWWEKDWKGDFDKIIDTVGGGNFVDKAPKVLKTRNEGGKFIAVTGDDTNPDLTSAWKAIKFFVSLTLRPIHTWIMGRTLPGYVALMPYDEAKGRKKVLDMMEENSLEIKLDDESPHPFTASGVREAFQKVASRHAHGKVVVSMESKSEDK